MPANGILGYPRPAVVGSGDAWDALADGQLDVDFTAEGPTIPRGGVWLNQQAGDTFEVHSGKGIVSLLGGNFTYIRGVEFPCPATSAWQVIIRPQFVSYVGGEPAIYLRDSAGGKIASITWRSSLGWIILKFTNSTTFSTDFGGAHNPDVPYGMPYMRIKKTSASSWAVGIGPTPRSFVDVWTGVDIGSWVTPDRIGFGGQTSTGAGIIWSVDYLHFT